MAQHNLTKTAWLRREAKDARRADEHDSAAAATRRAQINTLRDEIDRHMRERGVSAREALETTLSLRGPFRLVTDWEMERIVDEFSRGSAVR